ncbi:aldose 1-epimerase [Enterococcus sp. AZ194]|uniref:aldose epimerase family protein n=1 Tax=Enterococcus sp. AZ194 TaxID=2774629 RepID=UPI003F1EF220
MTDQSRTKNNGINCTILAFTKDLEIEFCNLGASIKNIIFSNKFNKPESITMFPENFDSWINNRTFAGSIVGPLAGRYSPNGYALEENRPPVHFHGGTDGIDKQLWEQEVSYTEEKQQISFWYSEGSLQIQVVYTLWKRNKLTMEIFGTSTLSTFFNPTNHVYFNLNGENQLPVTNHELYINSQKIYLENTDRLIRSIKLLDEEDFLNFSKPKSLINLEEYGGLDTTFQFDDKQVGSLYSPESGRKISISTTLPAAVIFTFNAPQPAFTRNNQLLPAFSGITFETQYPANHLELVELSKKRPYSSKTTYTFSIVD